MHKKNKTALGTIIFIIFFNIGTKFLGFYRDALIGRNLGAELTTDAYLMALSATTLIFLSVGSGIATTLIPIIVKENNKIKRQEIINNILNFVLIISLVIMAIYFLSTDFIISLYAGGFSVEKLALTVDLTKILLPTIIFINIAYLFVGILQSNENYILPTLISVPYNLIIIFYLFIGVDKFGVIGLAYITVVGWLLQLLIQVPRIIKLNQVKYKFKIDFQSPELKLFIQGLLPIVFVMATNQFATVIDNSYISYFGDGILTTFYYANMLFVAIATIIVYGVTAVMFPKFNKSYVENKDSFYEIITSVLEGIILLLIPVGVGIAVVSDQLISLIFLTDEFTIESVTLTSNFLKIYGTFMVAFGIMDIMNKAYYTKGDRKKPVLISLVILLSNLTLNYLFTNVFKIGIYGVLIATSLAFYIGIFVSLYLFKSDDGNVKYSRLVVTLTKTLISALLMFVVISILQNTLISSINISSSMSRLLLLCVSALVGVIIYFGSLLLLKEKILLNFIKSLRRKENKNEK